MRETDPILEQRVEEMLAIRLDGAKEWDARRYVAQKEVTGEPPWKMPEGGNPLSRRQIRNYIREADRRIAQSTRATRRRRIARHIAFRERLYARAVTKGDERTALAVLDSLAKLLDLFPSEGDALLHEMAALRKELGGLKARKDDGDGGAQTPGGGPHPGDPGGPQPGSG